MRVVLPRYLLCKVGKKGWSVMCFRLFYIYNLGIKCPYIIAYRVTCPIGTKINFARVYVKSGTNYTRLFGLLSSVKK